MIIGGVGRDFIGWVWGHAPLLLGLAAVGLFVYFRFFLVLGGNHFGIVAAVGLNGHGKTLWLVETMAVPAFLQGVPVVANFRLYPERLGCDPSLFVPLRSWRDITRAGVHMVTLNLGERDRWARQYRDVDYSDLTPNDEGEITVPRLEHDGSLYSMTGNRRAIVLLDEINAVLPSRSYQSVPPELLRVVNQLRKHDVTVGWTAPAWERADKSLREVTTAVWLCKGYVLDSYARHTEKLTAFPRALRDERGKKVPWAKGWPPRRLFRFRLYDAADFEEFSLDATNQRRITHIGSRWYVRSRHRAQVAYGTADGVMLLDHLDSFTGVCAICDGTKSRHKCKGHHDDVGEADPPEGREASPPSVPVPLPPPVLVGSLDWAPDAS